MNAINTAGIVKGFPATAVLRLTGSKPVSPWPSRNSQGDEAILAALQHPPRIGETRPIAALLPEVLSRYGLGDPNTGAGQFTAGFDVTA